MTERSDEDALFGQLDRLVATSRTLPLHDRRMVLSLEADLWRLRAALCAGRDSLAQKLNMAGARNVAMTAYSRTAFLGRSSAAGPINK